MNTTDYPTLPHSNFYFFENDDEEINRTQAKHFALSIFPAPKPVELMLNQGGKKVLDVGCGPGTWVLDMASKYTDSYFIGVDIAKIFPVDVMPKNVSFHQADILAGLNFSANEEYDYIYMRSMAGSIQGRYWESKVIPELVRVLKPGGIIQMVDIDWERSLTISPELLKQMLDFFSGKDLAASLGDKIEGYLHDTNQFETISHETFEGSLGQWGGVYGTLTAEYVLDGMRKLDQYLGPRMGQDEFEIEFENLKKAIENGRHTMKYVFRLAQKKI